MIEVANTLAYPLANAIRCALNISKTGVLGIKTDSLVTIPGINLNPHELFANLVNLSFVDHVNGLRFESITLSPQDRTLRDIAKKLPLKVIDNGLGDLDVPFVVITDMIVLPLIISSYNYISPITKSYIYETLRKQGSDPDSFLFTKLPFFQERQFPYIIEEVNEEVSRIVFTDVSKDRIIEILASFPHLANKHHNP